MTTAIELIGKKNRWSLSSWGGRLCGWEARDGGVWRKVCKGDPQLKPSADAFRAAVMFPWVNRIGGEEWSCEGQRTPLDRSGPLTHLHGVAFDAQWEVVEQTPTKASFRCVVEPQKFYPRQVEATATYAIGMAAKVESLDVSIVSKNLENSEIAYVTTGIHPYYVNPFGGKVDEMELYCAQELEFAVDDKLIPTRLGDIAKGHDFRASAKLGERFMDYGFMLKSGFSPAATLKAKNFALNVHPVENCGYMQIYIPPHREEIALEPQSGGADAFRFHQFGLRRLKPGGSFRFACQISAQFS